MYAIQKTRDQQSKFRPNILPCRINHNCSVNASRRYWSPTRSEDGKVVSYFRGRKLHGKAMKIPDGYKGVILSSTDQKLLKEPQIPAEGEELDDSEEFEDVGILEEQAEFDELMVWDHDALPDECNDSYVRSVEEWIAFAEQIHSPSQAAKLKNDPSLN